MKPKGKHVHKKKHHAAHAPRSVLRNPVHFQKRADAYGHSIEMQQKFLAAQRAINNRIQHDRLAASGVSAAILPSKIHG